MLNLKIKYKDGEIRQITNDLNKNQAKALIDYMKSGEYGMEKAILTVKEKK